MLATTALKVGNASKSYLNRGNFAGNSYKVTVFSDHVSYIQQFSRSYNNSSSEANVTPYSGVILGGVILTPKRSLKNSFSGVKVTPDIEELK